MHRLISMCALAVSLVAASTTAVHAQASGGPPIAFAQGGTRGDSIYLVDSDGTGLTKIYQGRSSTRLPAPIDYIAMRTRTPAEGGGGEVAFVERDVAFSLKIQPHHQNGQPNGDAYLVIVPAGNCLVGPLDYLANGTLVVADGCGQVWSVGRGLRTAEPLFRAHVNSMTAVDNTIYFVENNGPLKFRGTGEPTTVGPVSQPNNYLDATAMTAFLSDWQTFHTVDLATGGNDQPGCTPGGMTEVSPEGSAIAYRYRGNLLVRRLLSGATCANSAIKIGKNPRSFAWRTY